MQKLQSKQIKLPEGVSQFSHFGHLWKTCSEEEKKKLQILSDEDKQRYELALGEWRKSQTPGEDKKPKVSPAGLHCCFETGRYSCVTESSVCIQFVYQGIQDGLNSLFSKLGMLFRNHLRYSQKQNSAEGKDESIGFAGIAKLWKEADAETRTRFEMKAGEEKERWNQEMKVWTEKKALLEANNLIESTSDSEDDSSDSDSSVENLKPKKKIKNVRSGPKVF